METNPEMETEELTGRKKSRFKLLKTRLFSRLKRKDAEDQIKQSQSSSDVTTPRGRRGEDDSEDDSHYPRGTLSARALSHDSIFLSDQACSSDSERVLSQENVHSNIKKLQLKLQQQNMRLGPPSLLIPGKRFEDSGTTSEDDGLPCSPPEMCLHDIDVHRTVYKFSDTKKHLSSLSLAGTGSEEEEQPPSRPLSPASQLSPWSPGSTPTDLTSSGVDFSSPAQYVPCLDNSAARHRMSIKPRNQRASTKAKKPQTDAYRPQSNSMNHLDQLISEREETPQSVISTDAINLHSYPAQVTSLAEELDSVSLLASKSLLYKQEKATALDRDPVDPPSMDDEVLKAGELFQPEGRIITNPLFLQAMPVLFPLINADSQQSKETAVDCSEAYQLHPVKVLASDYYVMTEKSSERVEACPTEQLQTLKKAVDTDFSQAAESLTRPHHVPTPRTKKSTLENRNTSVLKISNTKSREFEKEAILPEINSRNTAPFGGLDESSTEDNKLQKLNSLQFSVASAKNRSRVNGENVAKKEEESAGDTSLKALSYNQSLEAQVQKTQNLKPVEVNKNSVSTSLLKEVILQNVSKTEVERNRELCEGCPQTTEPDKSKEEEQYEDKKNLFGVKLRTTSLSLKYRYDVAKSEEKTKRHSLEDHRMTGVSEWHAGKEPSFMDTTGINNDGKSHVLTKHALQNPDLQQDPTLDKVSDRELPPRPVLGSSRETDATRGAPWMTLAREKTRPNQPSTKPCSQPASLFNSTSSSTAITSFAPALQRPTPQHKPSLPLSTKSPTELQPSTQSTPQTPPKPAVRATASYSLKTENNNVNQLAKGVDLVEIKGPSKLGSKSSIQIESEVFRRTPTFTPTAKPESSTSSQLPHQQSPSDTTQPSWMELAKRKSLAWVDKSLD